MPVKPQAGLRALQKDRRSGFGPFCRMQCGKHWHSRPWKINAGASNAVWRQMRIVANLALGTAMLSAAVSATNAAPPDLQTPAPVIHLADNLDEAGGLGWCIDTIGRGLSDRLHAHSCKPQGGDVQFRLAEITGQIASVAFEGKCMAYLHPDDPSKPLGLVDCDETAGAQMFVYDPETMTIRPSLDGTKCLAVGANSRAAGPFMARDLGFSACSEADKQFQTWIVRR